MSLLDTLLGSLSGAAGPGRDSASNPLLQIAMSLLAGNAQGGAASSGAGGLPDLIAAFQRNGLGDVVQSWVGSGQNLPISPDQLQQALGGDLLGSLSQQLGRPQTEVSSGLAELLPGLVDRLTPQGQMPSGGLDVEAIMRAMGVGRG